MVLYPILLSQSWSTTVPNFMLVSGIVQSGQNLALSRLANEVKGLINSVDPDEMLHDAEFHLGLHCCQRKNLGVTSPLDRFVPMRLHVLHAHHFPSDRQLL